MFCDFRKAFGLDPEYNKQLEESMQEAEKKALKEKWCCTCTKSAIIYGSGFFLFPPIGMICWESYMFAVAGI